MNDVSANSPERVPGSPRRFPSRIRRASRTQYERQAIAATNYQRQSIELEEDKSMTQPNPPAPPQPDPNPPQPPDGPDGPPAEPEDEDQPEAPEDADEADKPA
jgi:hypothetical protein